MRLDQSAPWRLTRRTPTRGLAMPDAWVPLALGVGVGLVVTLAAWPLAGLADRLIRHVWGAHYVAQTKVLFALSVGFVTGAVVVVRAARQVVRGIPQLWSSEEDVQVLTPPELPAVPVVEVEVADIQGAWRRLQLPFDEEILREFAAGVTSGGRTLAMDDWTGSKRPLSREQYLALRTQLMERQLAYWKNPTARGQGWELTEAGWELMRKIAAPALPR